MAVAALPVRTPATILLVDPDAAFRSTARGTLTDAGFVVEEAASAEEALERIKAPGIAAVVLEVRLPGISGYEVCRALRERHGDDVAVIFVSGDRIEASDRVAGLLLGADDYLAKPVAIDELALRLSRLCTSRVRQAGAAGQGLTPREHEVLDLLAEGFGPVEIGVKLLISPKTVGTHVEHIYAKLGVHNRAQAVATAYRLALVGAS
jgi:DNA-binding NarL/FixJ family response regulator